MTILHGDNEDVLSCRLITLMSEATTPKPWTNNGTISAQYVSDASLTNSDVKSRSINVNDPRISRIVWLMMTLEGSMMPASKRDVAQSTFKRCSMILTWTRNRLKESSVKYNAKLLSTLHPLRALNKILSETAVSSSLKTLNQAANRHIYFVQVRPNPWLSFCFVLVSAMTVRPEQAGTEFQTLNATDNSERVQNLQELRLETKTDIKTEDSIQTTTHRVNEKVARTFESKDVDIACVRQTVSHMEVVSVEDQLVRVFCEQVALDFEPDSACKAPSPRPNGGHCKAPLRRPNCGPAPSDPARVALDATAPR